MFQSAFNQMNCARHLRVASHPFGSVLACYPAMQLIELSMSCQMCYSLSASEFIFGQIEFLRVKCREIYTLTLIFGDDVG